MPVYSSLYDLFSEPQIALYFAVLLWAAQGCARRSERALPLVAAAATLSVTWAYIVRYTVAYEGTSLFDDAYKDVLAPPHFGTSAQLLTWVVVAAAWARDASPCYMLFGELPLTLTLTLTLTPTLTLTTTLTPTPTLTPTLTLAGAADQRRAALLHDRTLVGARRGWVLTLALALTLAL